MCLTEIFDLKGISSAIFKGQKKHVISVGKMLSCAN